MTHSISSKIVSFAGGSHGSFLCLVLNVLSSKNISYDIVGKNFDLVTYSEHIENEYIGLQKAIGDICITIDNEILWLHQSLCRQNNNNYHILDYEKNFIPYSQKHPVLRHIIDDFIQMNKNKFPKHDDKKLNWFYKHKIFGVLKSAEPSQHGEGFKHKIPFSAFYNFEKFQYFVNQVIPTKNTDLLKSFYDQLHQNLIHNDKNIADTGSILYESWQEYVG